MDGAIQGHPPIEERSPDELGPSVKFGSPEWTVATNLSFGSAEPEDAQTWNPSHIYGRAPLARNQTRLVRLHPDTGLDAIFIELVVADLDEIDNQYIGLSYTWGNSESQRTVYHPIVTYSAVLDSENPGNNLKSHGLCHWPISEQLYDFLKAARAEGGPLLFWIDQLCINQNDLEERKQQVALMPRIYTGAAYVFIWMSEQLWQHPNAFTDIEHFRDMLTNNPDTVMYSEAVTTREERKSIEDKLPATVWQSLEAVLAHPYFQRIWIIQEVIKAKAAVMMLSKRYMPVQYIFQINDYLQRLSVSAEQLSPRLVASSRPLNRLFAMFEKLSQNEGNARKRNSLLKQKTARWTLTHLLLMASTSLCTDQRDRVYALVGLIEDELVCVPQQVIADYKRPYDELITSLFTFAITQQKVYATLDHCRPRPNRQRPSWAPSVGPNLSFTSELIFYKQMFSAAGTKARSARQNGHGIDFRLTRLGTISALSSHSSDDGTVENSFQNFTSQSVDEIREGYRQFESFVQEQSCDGLPGPFDILCAWQYDLWWREGRFKDAELRFKEELLLFMQASGGVARTNAVNQPLGLGMILRKHNRAAVLATFEHIAAMGQKRLVCWIPNGAQVGDEVVLIHGTRLPHLIRKVKDGEYVLQGGCYVYGAMDGEVFSDQHTSVDLTFV